MVAHELCGYWWETFRALQSQHKPDAECYVEAKVVVD